MVNPSRLAKVWKLTTSPNPGEAAAARERARVIVAREGKTLADVPNLLQVRSQDRAGKHLDPLVSVPEERPTRFMISAKGLRRCRETSDLHIAIYDNVPIRMYF